MRREEKNGNIGSKDDSKKEVMLSGKMVGKTGGEGERATAKAGTVMTEWWWYLSSCYCQSSTTSYSLLSTHIHYIP
jgi:hypothetical protein